MTIPQRASAPAFSPVLGTIVPEFEQGLLQGKRLTGAVGNDRSELFRSRLKVANERLCWGAS